MTRYIVTVSFLLCVWASLLIQQYLVPGTKHVVILLCTPVHTVHAAAVHTATYCHKPATAFLAPT